MRTKAEIETEVAALRALKPIGPHAPRTRAKIIAAIEALEQGVDTTAPEFLEETSADEQEAVYQAIDWKEGNTDDAPSTGWGSLVA